MKDLLTIIGIGAIIYLIIKKTNTIMATQQDALAKLDAIGSTLDKVSSETSGLIAEIDELKQSAAGEVSDELMAKIDSIASKAASIDALVADAPDTTTEEPPVEETPTEETPAEDSTDAQEETEQP